MIHEYYFQRENVADVDAAVVGVSRKRWIAVASSEASQQNASQLMQKHSFDILPVDDGERVNSYYSTDVWSDYSSISRKQVTHRDTRPYSTPIRDVISDFAENERLFFFLTAENDIVGLITVVNLNSRHVQVFLFGLICELESLLAEALSRNRTEEQLIYLFEQRVLPIRPNRRREVLGRFKHDRKKGTDASFSEYLYFTDLLEMMRSENWQGLSIDQRVKNDAKAIGNLRNDTMHPVKSLIRKPDDVVRLDKLLDSVEELLFQLRANALR